LDADFDLQGRAGEIRSQVDDEPVRVYRPGEAFFENPGSYHRVSQNASDTKPARLLAVLIVDAAGEGARDPGLSVKEGTMNVMRAIRIHRREGPEALVYEDVPIPELQSALDVHRGTPPASRRIHVPAHQLGSKWPLKVESYLNQVEDVQ